MSAKHCKKNLKALKQSFDELQASHECLKEDHEDLGLAHTKLEKAHSSLLEQVKKEEAKKKQVIVTCDVGLTCDIIDESFIVLLLLLPLTLLVALHLPPPTLPPLLVTVSLVMPH
jgi:prefoldin subunit 5